MAQVLFAADTTPSLVDLDANFTEVYNKTAYSTTGIGYATGAGGTVTQATSKSTGVTLNKACGQITMNNAALAAGASVSFTVTNSFCTTSDLPLVVPAGNVNYRAECAAALGGSFVVRVTNVTGGSLSDALAINFAIVKGATA